MRDLIPEYLESVMSEVKDETAGEIPTYIPALAEANPEWLGVAMCTMTGNIYSSGDSQQEFTIQSISKPFVYALAVSECGLDEVLKVVGMEPSGEAFNELSLGEDDKRPLNPMINAGAITVNQLVNGTESSVEDRVEVIRAFLSDLAGRELSIDEEAADGEMKHADRNMSIAYMLRSYGIITDDAADAVASYTRQCSVLVTVEDLAVMAATLAGGGVNPRTGKQLLTADVCRQVLAVTASCGMYDAAGRWLAKVGIPAKSGVSGGVIGMLPGQLGIATLSPRLDKEGNSVRGIEAFQKMSKSMGLHLMSTDYRAGSHAVRSIRSVDGDAIIILQGVVNFAAAESVLAALDETTFDVDRIILDVSRIVESHPIARRLLKEGLERMREDGHDVAVVDPDGELRDRMLLDGTQLPKIEADSLPDELTDDPGEFIGDDFPSVISRT